MTADKDALLREALRLLDHFQGGEDCMCEYCLCCRRIEAALAAAPEQDGNIGVRIVCAANKTPDGSLILQVRHCAPPEHQQGFIDNKGNWHSREQAYVIAKAAGQIIRRCGGDEGKLFSENLY